MKTMMTATISMASRQRCRASPGRASGLAPRSMIIVFAPFTVCDLAMTRLGEEDGETMMREALFRDSHHRKNDRIARL